MTQRCADPSFGIKAPALAILQLLAGMDPHFADWDDQIRKYAVKIETFPWYNGREKGVCLVMRPGPYCKLSDPLLYIAFGEDRRSTSLFIEHWLAPEPFNCPTLESRPEEVGNETYKDRLSLPASQISKVADKVFNIMAKHYETAKKANS